MGRGSEGIEGKGERESGRESARRAKELPPLRIDGFLYGILWISYVGGKC